MVERSFPSLKPVLAFLVGVACFLPANAHAAGDAKPAATAPAEESTPPPNFVPAKRVELGDSAFDIYKVRRKPEYDMVIGGDSRVRRGVSPEKMRHRLTDLRIFNYAFPGLCWTQQYLKAFAGLLDPKSERKTLVLGISPSALTSATRYQNGFTDAMAERKKTSSRAGAITKSITDMLRPLNDDELVEGTEGNHKRLYYDDGWAPTEKPGGDKTWIKRTFGKSSLDPEIYEGLLKAIQSWTSSGIRVYGFRCPTSASVNRQETEMLEFDQTALIRKFEAAGGVWLNIDPTGLKWEDGHHLNPKSALTFTDRLTVAILKEESRLGTPSRLLE